MIRLPFFVVPYFSDALSSVVFDLKNVVSATARLHPARLPEEGVFSHGADQRLVA